MSAFALTGKQRAFCAEVREIARTELVPLAESGTPGRVNRPLIAALGEGGLLERMFGSNTEASNGAGGTDITDTSVKGELRAAAALDLCLLRESLAYENTDAETALALQGLGAYPILLAGSRTQVERWRPAVASGRSVAAFALSEEAAGSDAAALELSAEPDGDGWRLRGQKKWISNAPEADVYTVFARTTTDARARGVTAFIVPGDRPGLSGEHIDLISPHPVGTLEFDDVRVGPDDMLGERDRGFSVAMQTLDLFRSSVGAFAVGMAQAALDAAARHVSTRRAFGGVLADQQAVTHKLADMDTRTEAARLLVYSAAAAYDAGAGRKERTSASAKAKLFATETAQEVVDAAIQLFGARALERGHLLEHLYRDVRAPRIYEGASEVQRTIIGRDLVRRAPEEE